MKRKLLEVLACPSCAGTFDCEAADTAADGEVLSGRLRCRSCKREFPITDAIPRFVPTENYATSFGYQWNVFKAEQLDSCNQTDLSAQRFFHETEWTPDWLKGRWIVETGCGSGRFLDIASKTGAQVVGVDLSNAVDAARQMLTGRDNVHLVQASIYELPFRRGAFDGVYCIGVIQHTPDPVKSLQSLPALLRPGGRLAVTIYERRRWTMLYSKYLVRRITRHLKPRTLLALVKALMPVLFPLTEVLFRIPVLGHGFKFAIPVANYVDQKELTVRQRYRWALLDTFDMLAPAYDQPMTQQEVEVALDGAGLTSFKRLANPGVNIVAEMPARAGQGA